MVKYDFFFLMFFLSAKNLRFGCSFPRRKLSFSPLLQIIMKRSRKLDGLVFIKYVLKESGGEKMTITMKNVDFQLLEVLKDLVKNEKRG